MEFTGTDFAVNQTLGQYTTLPIEGAKQANKVQTTFNQFILELKNQRYEKITYICCTTVY